MVKISVCDTEDHEFKSHTPPFPIWKTFMIILSENDILEFERIYEKDSIKRIQISFNSEISKQVNDYLQKIEDAHESAKKSKLIFNNYLTFTNP